jgi:hypothetical protein
MRNHRVGRRFIPQKLLGREEVALSEMTFRAASERASLIQALRAGKMLYAISPFYGRMIRVILKKHPRTD